MAYHGEESWTFCPYPDELENFPQTCRGRQFLKEPSEGCAWTRHYLVRNHFKPDGKSSYSVRVPPSGTVLRRGVLTRYNLEFAASFRRPMEGGPTSIPHETRLKPLSPAARLLYPTRHDEALPHHPAGRPARLLRGR